MKPKTHTVYEVTAGQSIGNVIGRLLPKEINLVSKCCDSVPSGRVTVTKVQYSEKQYRRHFE